MEDMKMFVNKVKISLTLLKGEIPNSIQNPVFDIIECQDNIAGSDRKIESDNNKYRLTYVTSKEDIEQTKICMCNEMHSVIDEELRLIVQRYNNYINQIDKLKEV